MNTTKPSRKSPRAGAKSAGQQVGEPEKTSNGNEPEAAPEKLSAAEAKQLARFEEDISTVTKDAREGFRKIAEASYQIKAQRLYREHGTLTEYFKKKFGYGRSHANRLADAGEVMEKLSPRGDILKKLDSESHFRPLTSLLKEPGKLEMVVDLLEAWDAWTDSDLLPAGMVRAAKVFLSPPTERVDPDGKKNEILEKVTELIAEAEAGLPAGATKEIKQIFQDLKAKAKSLGTRRTTNIAWTEATWNPLQGCTRASKGCDNCYAAKLLATRLADMYPDLAIMKGDGSYAFTGKILLLPGKLAEPLLNRTPRKYFVNSLSDLFHKDVPEEFITAVFDVMEKAHWHTFQVLTKRPERMAEFTQNRYKDCEAPSNIWLGTSTEDQDAFDKRMPHLKQVKAAVRWLSCEPLLGPITLTDAENIDWVVVGGESNGGRKMEKAWAASLRDQCAEAKISFFFKQWGDFSEEGESHYGKKEHDATLDGKIHHDDPEE